VQFTIHWRAAGPVMVRAGGDGLAVDALPLTTGGDGGRMPILPGSSIKGALRTQAERIVRTVRGDAVADGELDEQVRAGDLVEWLFGWSPRSGNAGSDSPKGLACLWVEDCLAERSVPPEVWRAVTSARWISEADKEADLARRGDEAEVAALRSEAPLREVLDRAGLYAWEPATHVALDRWTGGAADQRLFSVLEPREVRWRPIVLDLDLARLPRHLWDPALALLLLVLNDLAAGEVPLGFATNRGMGDLELTGLDVEVPEELSWLARHEPVEPGAGVLAAYDPNDVARLATAWQSWIGGSDREAT
jgi:CRISPR/Cas system CSM-associated protein Csm3 (group 7 of RAMP superfamily)